MANYAVGGPTRDYSAYNSWMAGLNPDMYANFDREPQQAYENWLRMLGFSLSEERNLRQAMSSFYNDFLSRPSTQGYGNPLGNRWVDYLRNLDVNREMARLGPEGRGEDARRYQSPTRWVTFG